MAAGPLTRSRIEAFDQTANQLSHYAARWRAAGGALDHAAEVYVAQIANPTGTQWQGQAAAEALEVAQTDRVSVTGAVIHAHEMADIANQGSSSLLGAREGALQAIADAEADEFTVGEDLSVADNHHRANAAEYAARMARAQAHIAYIEHHAGLLEAENQRVATQLGAGAGQMTGMVPATWQPAKVGAAGVDDTILDDGSRKPTIQAVDNHRGLLPADSPPPAPGPHTGDPIKLPPRTTPPPPTVISAAPPDSPPPQRGFPNCSTNEVLKREAEVLAGGLTGAAGLSGGPLTAGAGLAGGGWMIWDGIDGLEACK